MRLTLRTLLAYLDDVLEPSETKVIGQKIQESAVAGKLISLIKLVVRQRRLKSPSVSGPDMGIDPNVVAQYLDNTLPSGQVVDVERVLLTSDELLAEVASCHQVLALAVGQPVEIAQPSLDRLYALGPVPQSEQLRVDEPSESEAALNAAAARDAEKINGAPRPAAKPVAEIPEYLRRSSWSQQMVPASIVALLVLVCAGLVIMDPSLVKGLLQAKRELAETGKTGSAPATETVADAIQQTQQVADTSSQTALDQIGSLTLQSQDIPPPAMPATNDQLPSLASTAERPAVGTSIKPATPVVGQKTAEVPADASVAAKNPPTDIAGPNGNSPAAERPLIKSPVAVNYNSSEGIVLRLDDATRHWFQLPRRSAVTPGELLVVPEPFEALLEFDRGTILATVLGDSSLRIATPNRLTGSGLNFNRGRVLLKSARKELPADCGLSVSVGGDSWVLEFLSADTVCTIEIAPREPFQFEKPFEQNWYLGVLRVLSGKVKWTGADGQTLQVAAQTALEIAPPAGTSPKPAPSAFVPEWADAQKRKQAPLRRSAPIFEKQFELDQPVEQMLLSLVRDPHAKVSELAIRNLGLIDDYASLVQALAECDYEEGRFAARDGIREWLGRSADRGPLLKTELELRFPILEARAAYILLWGFRPEDGSDPIASLELVNWLKSTHVAIRELAIFWIIQLTNNRRTEYRATDVMARREAAIRKLEAHVKKDGALVKPPAKEPAAPKPE